MGHFLGIIDDVRQHRNIYVLALCAAMIAVVFGWDTGMMSGVLAMESFQASFGLQTLSPAALATVQGNITSALQGGAFFGALSSAYLSGRFGRYPALYLAAIIFLVGSTIQTAAGLYSTSLVELYLGRFIGGFGVGLSTAVAPSYISESSPPEVRGRCTGIFYLLNMTGLMLSFWVNYGLAENFRPVTNPNIWRTAFAVQMVPGVVFLVLMLNQHESPRWLIEKGRVEEARVIMARLRQLPPSDPIVEKTVQETVDDLEGKSNLSLWTLVKMACASRIIFYRCSIGPILMFFAQWAGTPGINYYAPEIFQSLGFSSTDASLFATGVYGIIKMSFTGFGLLLAVEQYGRKRCLFIGGLGLAATMFFIGAYMKIHPTGPPVPASYAAITMLYLYAAFYSFSWGTCSWVVAAEAVPNHLRMVSMSVAVMTQWLFNYVLAQVTPTLLNSIKYGTFFLFGSICVIMSVYVWACLPETRGIPLEHIHEVFEGNVLRRSIAEAPGGRLVSRIIGWKEESGLTRTLSSIPENMEIGKGATELQSQIVEDAEKEHARE